MTDPELMLLDEPAAGLDLGGREDLVRRLGDARRATPRRRRWCWSPTTSRRSRPTSPTSSCCARAASSRQGPVEITLTEANLSATFGMPLELERRGDRWTARLQVAGGTPERPLRPRVTDHERRGRMDWLRGEPVARRGWGSPDPGGDRGRHRRLRVPHAGRRRTGRRAVAAALGVPFPLQVVVAVVVAVLLLAAGAADHHASSSWWPRRSRRIGARRPRRPAAAGAPDGHRDRRSGQGGRRDLVRPHRPCGAHASPAKRSGLCPSRGPP